MNNKKETHNTVIDGDGIKHESVKTSFIFNLLIQLLTYIIPLITSPYLSRVLTPNGVGISSYVNSIASYFTLVIAFGFTTYGTQKISSTRSDKRAYSNIFWNIFFTRFLLFLVVTAIYLALTLTWSFGNAEYKQFFLIYVLLLISSFADITYLFQGLEKFRVASIVNVVVRIIAAVSYFIFVKSTDDLASYLLIFTLQNVVIFAICWIVARKYVLKPEIKSFDVILHIKNGFIYFLPTIAISVYTILDRTMLGALTDSTQVGYYEQAYKIISLCTALINAISPIMLSRISYLIKQGNEEEVERKTVQMSEVYALLAWPMVMGLYAVARYFYPAFFGDSYVESVCVSYILTPLILAIPISNQIGSAYYVPRNRNKIITIFFVAGALLNFGTNWIFIPMLGARGAALTSLFSEFVISSLFIVFSWKHVNYKKIIAAGLKPFIASLVMFGALMCLNYFVFDVYINNIYFKTAASVLTGILIYGVFAVLLKEPMVLYVLKKIFKKFAIKKGGDTNENL